MAILPSGEEVLAVLERQAGEAYTAAEVQAFRREHLASDKVPRYIQFRKTTEFPRTETAKEMKRQLRQQAMQRLREERSAHTGSHHA
jgi:acyl-CoA synthetase (AMP-forming)/AMP-acid ligase II